MENETQSFIGGEMMREIKVRAWTENTWLTDTLKEKMIYDYQDTTLAEVFGFNSEELPVMQYTGLKDKNGTEIYEGDILQLGDSIPDKGVVDFYRGSFRVKTQPKYNGDEWRTNLWDAVADDFEVIGNIYEHRDLLDK